MKPFPLLRHRLLTTVVTAAVLCLAPAVAQAQPAAAFPIDRAPAGVSLPPAPAASHMSPLAVVDVDRDGDADLVALAGERTWHVWLNHGDGRFQHTATSVAPTTLWGPDAYLAGGRTHGRSPIARLKVTARANPGTFNTTHLVTLRLVLAEPTSVAALAFNAGSPRSPPFSVQ